MGPKRAQVASYLAPLPPPNGSHPSSSSIPLALAAGRPHPPSYHTFIASPFYPTASSTNGGKKSASALPALADRPIAVEVVHAKVLSWYDGVKDGRGMPWRKEVIMKDLSTAEKTQRGYEVWVSEIMLQQTQVATVIAYFNRWMSTFPTLASLAQADIEQVNSVWAGLGYYSRASRLLAGAKTVMREFKGTMPQTAADLEKIDGIGPYSAGAISSIAYSKRAAMVDGNVTRLTAHHAPPTAKATTSFIWALADTLVPSPDSTLSVGGPNKPGSWNQGLMELGATICTPKNPKCGECPLSDECLAYAEVRTFKHRKTLPARQLIDLEDLCELCEPVDINEDHVVMRYPMAKAKKKLREEETAVCVLEWESSASAAKGRRKVLLVKRPEKGLLAGLFEFPAIDLPPSEDSTAATRRTQLHTLLSTLVDSPLPILKPSSSSSAPLTITSTSDLGAITQVYSHQTRLYHILRVIVSSLSPPPLSKATSSSATKSLQSLAGRAKWVDEADVAGSNIGGAVGKVWDVRQSGKSGVGKLSGKPRAVGAAEGAKKARGAKRVPGEVRTREDDEFIVGSDEEVEIERSVKKRKVVKNESPPPAPVAVRKKPRILISDDEEE